MAESNINKNLYKTFLILVKYIPITLALIFLSQNVLVYIEVITPILLYLGGSSLIFIVLLYILSWVFRFCYLYRIPLHYVTIGNVVGILDKWFIFPLSNIGMLRIYFALFGVMTIVYIWLTYKNIT